MTTLQFIGTILCVIGLSTLAALGVAHWMGHRKRTRI